MDLISKESILEHAKESRRVVSGREICACIQYFDHGIQVTVTGGDLSHIGSVSVVDEKGVLSTTVFPSHKDHVIGDRWAERLYEKYHVPIVVTAGIHYDDADREKIVRIMETAEQLFEEIIGE